MASASKTVVMDASAEKIYSVLTDYESYSDFMDGVSKVEILSKDGSKVKVRYSINVIKKFSYVLNIEENEGKGLSWTFDSGDIFSLNSGSWELNDLGDGSTEVTYNIEVDIKIKMMGAAMIAKKLTEVQLPSMLKSVESRAQSV